MAPNASESEISIFTLQPNDNTEKDEAKSQRHGDRPEVQHRTRGVGDAGNIHAEEAGHKRQWKEEYGDHGEHEDGFAVIVLKGLHELDVLLREKVGPVGQFKATLTLRLDEFENVVDVFALILESQSSGDAWRPELFGVQ